MKGKPHNSRKGMRATQSTLSNNLTVALLPILPPMERSNPNHSISRADSSAVWEVLLSPEFGIYSLGSRVSHRLDISLGVGCGHMSCLSEVTRECRCIWTTLIASGHVIAPIVQCLARWLHDLPERWGYESRHQHNLR